MYSRILHLSLRHSFFLFGMRGTGKSTYLKQFFKNENVLWIDLLTTDDEIKYRKNPDTLIHEISSLKKNNKLPKIIVIDEIQKIPALLDVVHHLIEKEKLIFGLTGSSARKLKRGGANLLAGRAFVFNMYPLTHIEIADRFDLGMALSWGTLPALWNDTLSDDADKVRFLKAYVNTYLKEEILMEQIIRNVDPFYTFLECAAQTNGDIVNFSKIARDTGVSDKTVQNYYSILEDTLIGFHLLPYHRSVRKQQIVSSKFYFHDTGVVRALRGEWGTIQRGSTFEYGKLFESFVICEIVRLNRYTEKDFPLYYLKTKDGVEIDIIIKVSSKKHYCIEIKSGDVNSFDGFSAQIALSRDIPGATFLVFSQKKTAMANDDCNIIPWQDGLKMIFQM